MTSELLKKANDAHENLGKSKAQLLGALKASWEIIGSSFEAGTESKKQWTRLNENVEAAQRDFDAAWKAYDEASSAAIASADND